MSNYLIAGGGTGGHVYPGFAVAEALNRIDPAARVDFACTTRAIDRKILEPWRGRVLIQPIQPFGIRPVGLMKFLGAWWKTRRQIRRWLAENQIAGVLGLGGFGSGAAVYEAAKMGLRTAFLNPDFVPGRANRWLSRYADKIFVQWEGTQQYFHRPVDVCGVPLRQSICDLAGTARPALRQEARRRFGLVADQKTLVVMGGSTGARSLNDAVGKALAGLAEGMTDRWQVLHITGTGDYERVGRSYPSIGRLAVKRLAYSDRMDLVWAGADLAVCRAGAISLAEVTVAAVPSLLLPYPYHRDNHQAKNAEVLVRAGAAVLIPDDKVAGPQTVNALRQSLMHIISDETVRNKMIEAAQTLRRVDAAQQVAQWLIGS